MSALADIYIKKETLKTILEVLDKKGEKGISLTVSQNLKYEGVYQEVKDQFMKVIRTIKHYLAK